MAVLWEHPDGMRAAQILPLLDYPKVPDYTTVTTILGILYTKGLVTRQKIYGQRGRPCWCHQPAVTRDEYLAGQVAALLACARDPLAVVAVALSEAGRGAGPTDNEGDL